MRMIAISGMAQNTLDGSLLPGYNRFRIEEFERACSMIDPDFKVAADARASEVEEEKKADPKAPSPEKAKSFLKERDRIERVMREKNISAEEFLRT